MEAFLLKLAVAVIPLILPGVSAHIISTFTNSHSNHLIARHRQRRQILRSMTHGALQR